MRGKGLRARLSCWAAVISLVLLAACAGRQAAPASPPAAAAPPLSGNSCLATLESHGVSYKALPDFDAPHPCGLDTPVLVAAIGPRFDHKALMGCALAETLARFESEAVEPAAEDDLGRHVAGIVNMGAYSCRHQVGGEHTNYVSMHSYGLAIDIGGWIFDDGEKALFLTDWSGGDSAKRRFLHDAASAACRYFSVVLTPATNRAHLNHMHVDIGPYRFCGAMRGRKG